MAVLVAVSGGDPGLGLHAGACLDTTLRRIGGAPTYVRTDNAKTAAVEHIAGIPVRHPQMVAAGRALRLSGGQLRA
ncbi:hypothetical protein [Streptomyces bobili]|uniref:hypothetical protein n=1 Tax=Streptomyces bobili TaxID=67280 RepID=UPI003788E3EA